MSTLLSPPLSWSFTSTLQPSTVSHPVNAIAISSLALLSSTLGISMSTSLCRRDRPVDSSSALRDVRDGDREVAMNFDFSEQSFYRAHFRDRRVGKRAEIILNLGKVLRQVRVPHR